MNRPLNSTVYFNVFSSDRPLDFGAGRYDQRGTVQPGCVACNVWEGDKSSYLVELNVEDWEALGRMPESVRWILRSRKTQ